MQRSNPRKAPITVRLCYRDFMDRNSLAQAIHRVSHLTGAFKLRSGEVSTEYFDKYMFESDPGLLNEVASQMRPLIPADTALLAGLELGGVPISTALSLLTGLPQILVRKKAKDYGTSKIAEGPAFAGKQVCVVEDVVTTGGQIILSVEALRRAGALVRHVLCVIQRKDAATAALAAHRMELVPLFRMVNGALT